VNDRHIMDPMDASRVIERYRKRIREHGPTLYSLNSGTADKQRLRHEIHATAIRSETASILDIGSGIGGFYQYLREEGFHCEYTGYDIVPEYVEFCSREFPECRFELRNIFESGIGGTFDSIVLSQTLNNRYENSDNVAVMSAALQRAYESSRCSVSFDMLSGYADRPAPELFYYSPEEIFAFAKTLTRRVTLRHDYRPFEFCIQLFHESVEGYIP
jgi:SAM-dependent methyltransferase